MAQTLPGRTPVEGPSEIDIAFEGRNFVAFVEAKLGSDVSLNTTYDPARNQIARNVDCLLETCGRRRPLFWMFVRDRQPARAYVQLMNRYRESAALQAALPHRSDVHLQPVTSGLAVVTWADLMTLIETPNRVGIEAEVERELLRRVR